jgi:hypothetical protein
MTRSAAQLDAVIDELTVDAFDDEEQLSGSVTTSTGAPQPQRVVASGHVSAPLRACRCDSRAAR